MRIRWAVLALALASCGRLGFDVPAGVEAPDGGADTAMVGHDEDGDGLPDDIDPCPATAGDATDSDSDGVGDACDPHPATPGDSIAVFSPLTPDDQPFDNPDFMQEADDLRAIGGMASLVWPMPFTAGRIEVGFDILEVLGAGQHQVSSGVERSAPYYFVELNENGPIHDAAVVSYDTTNGYQTLGAMDHAGFHTGRGILRYDVTTVGTPHFQLVAGWEGELYTAAGETPQYDGGFDVRFIMNGVDVQLRYVLIVRSPG